MKNICTKIIGIMLILLISASTNVIMAASQS